MEEIIKEATEMTRDIPASDILVPLQQPEDENLTPLPEIEYKVIEANTMDKLVRDVNNHLKNGWQTEWGVQVVSWQLSRFYQAVVRWVVKNGNIMTKPEMPSQNSEAGTMGSNGPLWEGMSFLNDEPDLYEDIAGDADE